MYLGVKWTCGCAWLQYEQLDEQHKGLFVGVFDCAKSPGDAATFDKLKSLVKAHFDCEEVSIIDVSSICVLKFHTISYCLLIQLQLLECHKLLSYRLGLDCQYKARQYS